MNGMLKSWDSGTNFPGLVGERARVQTSDSNGEDSQELRCAEDEILADFEYFAQVRDAVSNNREVPVREKPVDVVIAELRKLRVSNGAKNPGGSLENKIRRIRENDGVARKRRRVRSLLERCAVVGEHISVTVTLRNPLHFPVFVNDMSPVVTLDGKCFSAPRANVNTFPVQFMPEDEIVLGPRSVQDVVLKIVVHEPGVLRFIGAQWLFTVGMGDSRSRASSQVPGFAKLERRGRRLNETRDQRASEVPRYEADKSLEVEVTPPAPRICVRLEGLEEGEESESGAFELRVGELRKANLTLKNEGSLEARGIAFRIDTPHSLFLDTNDLEQYNFRSPPSSNDMGPVQLLDEACNLAQNGSPVVAGFVPMRLEPGATVSHTVWLRASIVASSLQATLGKSRNGRSGSKTQANEQKDMPPDCPYAITIAYGAARARVSRCEGRLFVRPSVIVSRRFMSRADPSILPDSAEHGGIGMMLGVEVEHSAHAPSDMPVFQIECLSVTSTKEWRLSSLPPKTKSVWNNSGGVSNKATTLRANETATLFAVLHSKEVEGVTSPSEWHTSHLQLGLDTDTGADSPTSISQAEELNEYAPRDTFHDAARHFVLTNQLRTSLGAPKTASQPRADIACISVRWRDYDGARGELYLQPLDLHRWLSSSRPASAMHTRSSSGMSLNGLDASEQLVEESREIMKRIAAEAPPLRVIVRHAKHVVHNFSRATPHGNVAMPVVVPVDVYIKNVSQRLIDVIFAAAPHGGIADGDRGRYWAGDISMSLRALPPDSERFLQLSAIVDRAGRYNMAQFTVKYQISLLKHSQKKIPFPVEPSFVVVVDSADTVMEAMAPDGMMPKTPVNVFRKEEKLLKVESTVAELGNGTSEPMRAVSPKPLSPKEKTGNHSPVRKLSWRVAQLQAESPTGARVIGEEKAIWRGPGSLGRGSLL